MPRPFGRTAAQWIDAYRAREFHAEKPGDRALTINETPLEELILIANEIVTARDALGELTESNDATTRAKLVTEVDRAVNRLNAVKDLLVDKIDAAAAAAQFPQAAVRALEDIADAQAIQTALANEGPPVEMVAGLSFIAQTIQTAATTGEQPFNDYIRRMIPDEDAARIALDQIEAGNPAALLAALPFAHELIDVAKPLLVFLAVPMILDFVKDHYPQYGERIAGFGSTIGHTLMDGFELIHGPMKTVMEGGADLFITALQHQLESLESTTPENVLEVAAKLVTEAGAIGMSSHIVASIAEHFHPGKHLGLPQLAAFLADLSDFKRVATETFGQHISAALHSPARRRANFQFRPELPDPFAWAEIFFGRHIAPEEFREWYAQQGWRDEHIAAYEAAIYRKASPRELALVFEDGSIDDAWALRMLLRGGFNDEDAPLLLNGIKTRAAKGARQDYIAAVLANFEEGLYDEATTRTLIERLRLNDETQQLLMASAQNKRLRGEASKLRTVYETLATDGRIVPEELEAVMAALGYDEVARQNASARVTAKLAGKAFHEANQDEKALVRRVQLETITALKEEYRRLEITLEQLVGGLVAVGLRAEEAQAIARVAAATVVPVPVLPQVLTPQREQQNILKDYTEAVLAELRNGAVDPDTAYATLLSFGVVPDVARADVNLAAARITFPAPKAGLELKTPAVRAAEAQATREANAAARAEARDQRQLVTLEERATEEAFKKLEIGPDELVARLVALGQSREAATAVRDRLNADRAALQRAQLASSLRKDQQAVETTLKDAALLAFRNGYIDEQGLRVELAAAGVPAAEVSALVQRELARKKPAKPSSAVSGSDGGSPPS